MKNLDRAIRFVELITSIATVVVRAIRTGDERTVDEVLGEGKLESELALAKERAKTVEALRERESNR